MQTRLRLPVFFSFILSILLLYLVHYQVSHQSDIPPPEACTIPCSCFSCAVLLVFTPAVVALGDSAEADC